MYSARAPLPVGGHIEIWIWVALEIVLIVVAIRMYRAKRTATARLLTWACLAYVFPGLGWYVFHAVHYFLRFRLAITHDDLMSWQAYTDRAFQIIFMLLIISALISFRRESLAVATPEV